MKIDLNKLLEELKIVRERVSGYSAEKRAELLKSAKKIIAESKKSTKK